MIMRTFLKYLFYILLLLVIYVVGKGVYDGKINKNTTVEGVVSEVSDEAQNVVKKGVDAADKAIDDYKKAPKKEVDLE